MIWNLIDLMQWASTAQTEIGGKWVPVRPIAGGWSLRRRVLDRLAAAWAVITGRAEAFSWPEGQ